MSDELNTNKLNTNNAAKSTGAGDVNNSQKRAAVVFA